jgi:hypothetical protein
MSSLASSAAYLVGLQGLRLSSSTDQVQSNSKRFWNSASALPLAPSDVHILFAKVQILGTITLDHAYVRRDPFQNLQKAFVASSYAHTTNGKVRNQAVLIV